MLCLFLLGVLLLLVVGGFFVSLTRTVGSTNATMVDGAPPALAKAEPYTFPSVVHTPEETARARLVCAQAGEYGWSVAYKRQRTGLTLEEALALLPEGL
jgi:hypothetical protein